MTFNVDTSNIQDIKLQQAAFEADWQRSQELARAEHQERLKAAETMFPRAHPHIKYLPEMIKIAREDQLNPLYEQVLKDFDEAALAMSRAANKLATAVKITDHEALDALINPEPTTHLSAKYHPYWKISAPTNQLYTTTVSGNTSISGSLNLVGSVTTASSDPEPKQSWWKNLLNRLR